jgi:hypothetical protein
MSIDLITACYAYLLVAALWITADWALRRRTDEGLRRALWDRLISGELGLLRALLEDQRRGTLARRLHR